MRDQKATNDIVPVEAPTPRMALPDGAVVLGIGSGGDTQWSGWRFDGDGVTVETVPHYRNGHAHSCDVTIRFRARS